MPKRHSTAPPHDDAFFGIFESARVRSGHVATRALSYGESHCFASSSACFHYVEGAHCRLHVVGYEAPIALHLGDLVILPQGRRHLLERTERTGMSAQITTGEFTLEGSSGRLLTSVLPVLLQVPNVDKSPAAFPDSPLDWLAVTMAAIRLESSRPSLGSSVMVSRLIDLLFVWSLRHWLATAPAQARGWMRALDDDVIGRALMLLHAHPARAWSVDILARQLNQSRSSFSQRFVSLMGVPPMRYLARERMHMAADLLETTRLRVSQIAQRVGYESEPAFSRAFRRQMGIAPLDYRTRFR